MNEVLKAILIAPGQGIVDVLAWSQGITIRKGYRDYNPGDTVALCCHVANFCVLADITVVVHTKLRDVTVDEYEDAGYSTQDDLLKSLQKYYTEVTLDSEVTVIRWNNTRGKMIGNV